MARFASLAILLAVPSLAITAASPLSAQSSKYRIVTTPDGRTVYVVEAQPKDTRTPRQRCVEQALAAAGGSASQLAMAAIDLKCSQR